MIAAAYPGLGRNVVDFAEAVALVAGAYGTSVLVRARIRAVNLERLAARGARSRDSQPRPARRNGETERALRTARTPEERRDAFRREPVNYLHGRGR